jgi:3',5'-cyclic AMP phosphodiesterase CpdA
VGFQATSGLDCAGSLRERAARATIGAAAARFDVTRPLAMLIAQISDPHVTAPGESPGADVDSAANLARAIAQIEALDPRPDAVVLSGDLVERGTAAEYARLAELLAPLPLPCWLMAGNHDDRAELRRVFPAQPSLAGVPGFLQYEVDLGRLRLLVLDSLEPGTPAGRLCATRLGWLEDRLAADPARPTVVFVHHPPFATGLPHLDRSRLLDGDALGAVVARHRCVRLVACGHVHRPLHLRWAGTAVAVCPSTAHQFALDLRPDGRIRAVAEPPAFMLHHVAGESLLSFTVPVA